MVVEGLLSSSTDFSVTSLTQEVSVNNRANQHLMEKGVKIVAYDLGGPREKLVGQLKEIHVLISCNAWEHLHLQIRWIEAAKEAGMKRFVPSERVGPAPRGIRQNSKNEILGAIQRARLPYTIINMGCWYQVWVPRVPSERSDHAHSIYIDHQIVGDGRVRFALAGLSDIGKYVAQIVADPRTLNRHVLAYTEVLSMNDIWDAMAKASGEQPLKDYASSESMSHPSNIMDTASFNMGQYCISWCVRGDNTPEYADYLGYLDYWKLFPNYTKGKRPESNLPRSSLRGLIRNSSHSFP
ncbi:isoflavone reductase family protein [Aspergillus falconensis]